MTLWRPATARAGVPSTVKTSKALEGIRMDIYTENPIHCHLKSRLIAGKTLTLVYIDVHGEAGTVYSQRKCGKIDVKLCITSVACKTV